MPTSADRRFRAAGWVVVVAIAATTAPARAAAETDRLQQAVNYVFTGSVDPKNGVEIADRPACIVVLPDPRSQRFIRYYLSRFRMDDALFDKTYSGTRVNYRLDVKGDDVILEYLSMDKQTVLQGYRSAQIPLPGDIDQTQRAFRLIFSDFCKPQKSRDLF
jgi:hypothetical protein